MAAADGQIVLGLDIPQTTANIQSALTSILSNLDTKQLVLKTAIEKAEVQKSVSALVKEINAQSAKIGVSVNEKDVRSVLTQQQKIASTTEQLKKQMQEYKQLASDLNLTLNSATQKAFGEALSTQNFDKAKEAIRAVKNELKTFDKNVSIGDNLTAQMEKLKKDASEFGVILRQSTQTNFKNAINTGDLEKAKEAIVAVKNELKQLNEVEDIIKNVSASLAFPDLQKQNTGGAVQLKTELESIKQRAEELKNIWHTLDSEGIAKASAEMETLKERTAVATRQAKEFGDSFGGQQQFEKLQINIQKAQHNIEALGTSWSAMKKNPELLREWEQLVSLSKTLSTSADLSKFNAQVSEFSSKVKQAGLNTKTLGEQFKTTFANFSYFFSASRIIYSTIQAIKDMINNVTQLDSAMVELKKVTEATDAEFDKFLSNAKSQAVDIGSTITDLVNATADFSRLGYSLKDAEYLGQVATIYANVGDDVSSIDQATTSLISTMKGFGMEASQSMDIIDKFNEVGNKFAISSGGIGDALQRSAASMAAANNTIDESIALIVAANNVIQDPDVVGEILRPTA